MTAWLLLSTDPFQPVRCVPLDACVYGGAVIDPIEVVWTVITGVTLALTLVALYSAVLDRRFVRDTGLNSYVSLMTKESLIRESVFAVIQTLLFGLGLYALFLPPPVVRPVHQAGEALVWVFIAFALLLLYITARGFVARRRLSELALRRYRRGSAPPRVPGPGEPG